MNQIAKTCVALAGGAGFCVTGPAWATVAVTGIVAGGIVYAVSEMSKAQTKDSRKVPKLA